MNRALQSIIDQIRHLLRPITSPEPPRPAVLRPVPVGPPLREQRPSDPRAQALLYLNKVQAKINKLAQDFNAGTINRAQFQNLYVHYQREMRNVEAMLETAPAGNQWQGAVTVPISGTYQATADIYKADCRAVDASLPLVVGANSRLVPTITGQPLVGQTTLITISVQNEYGVAIHPETFEIDREETGRLRLQKNESC